MPLETRSRARYLEGNLLFLDQRYEDAVHAYDRSLTLAPAALDAGDPVARDAAWNRSIALRRIEDKKDAGEDASEDASHDASQDAPHDAASEGGGGQDAGHDSGGDSGSSGDDAGPSEPPDAGSPPPPEARANEEERILDQLENAPTVQEEQAKKKAQKRRVVQGMMDK